MKKEKPTGLEDRTENELMEIFHRIITAPGELTNEDLKAIAKITKELKRREKLESCLLSYFGNKNEELWSKI